MIDCLVLRAIPTHKQNGQRPDRIKEYTLESNIYGFVVRIIKPVWVPNPPSSLKMKQNTPFFCVWQWCRNVRIIRYLL